MPEIEPVDLVLTDPPYGITGCRWDSIIHLKSMWDSLERIVKPDGAIVLMASQPFVSVLVMSNLEMFRYEWIWRKNRVTGFLNAKKRPLVRHEHIVMFSQKNNTYNPQMKKGRVHTRGGKHDRASDIYGEFKDSIYESNEWYPDSVLDFDCQSDGCVTFAHRPNRIKTHPTQKPVALMIYLIETYTNKGGKILDFTIGSGTTAIACEKLNRRWIGIEISEEYCEIAAKRIENETRQLKLFV